MWRQKHEAEEYELITLSDWDVVLVLGNNKLFFFFFLKICYGMYLLYSSQFSLPSKCHILPYLVNSNDPQSVYFFSKEDHV